MLDTVVAAETPEGIVLELRPAGFVPRLFAFFVDWGVRLVIIYGAAIVLGFLGRTGTGLLFILIFLLEWLYPAVFEISRWGATPGKRTVGVKVVMDNGLPVTPAAALVRNLLRAADFLPFAYAFALVSMLTRRDGKRLGDIAAGTMVVHERRAEARTVFEDVAPRRPARSLALDEQAAIVALASRANRLTPARLDELAALAADVSGDAGHQGPAVTARVLGVARWVLGQR